MFASLMNDYMEYKRNYAKNIMFDPNAPNLSKYYVVLKKTNSQKQQPAIISIVKLS